jgi:hypothetical protein
MLGKPVSDFTPVSTGSSTFPLAVPRSAPINAIPRHAQAPDAGFVVPAVRHVTEVLNFAKAL